jgi:trans-aconitate 3-methyltransferase
MAAAVASNSQPTKVDKELGFSVKQGANWGKYLEYRPLYPPSFFKRIYNYHAQKPQAAWSLAHDVGAGCGVVSSTLASRFNGVVISDPNDGYADLARKLLVDESGIPASKLRFLQEGAEKSSVKSGTVDLMTVCECIHWTDVDVAIKEFARELKTGGTLMVSHYTVPKILDNERAQNAWQALWDAYSERAQGPMFDHAFNIVNSGLDHLEFPTEDWENVKRTYINARGSMKAFEMNSRVGESKVKGVEERIWEDGDKDWCDEAGLDWFKGYLGTWVPKIPETEIQDLWDEFEHALKGKNAKFETPIAMVFATKKA